ncbi:late embryogenesis abundant protein D-34-like [Durio zibethinus]|uniref:Late embryogenesis abundant protein D-34-like n=1 Tax=Durio zibethinus TaxID=66656 RepID=A0A6P6A4X4_DURZI|nr:late embryogenesis abundant protein D-34-like [Durio zibethinus]
MVLGQTRKSGPAAVMQSAATSNERDKGLVRDDEANVAGDEGASVIKSDADGEVWIIEAVEGQVNYWIFTSYVHCESRVVGRYIQPEVSAVTTPATLLALDPITVGEALETASFSAADRPIDRSDAAAIQAAEVRATRSNEVMPGDIASEAQSLATRNSQTLRFEDQATLSDILSDATLMLPRDKAVTPEDADKVVAAKVRNNPNMTTTPGGVGAAMAAAAWRSQNSTI